MIEFLGHIVAALGPWTIGGAIGGTRTMASFGEQLRYLRYRAGLGLRTFAELVNERASTVSAIELGYRLPWHRQDKLDRVADVLGLAPASEFSDEFFSLARRPSSIDTHHDNKTRGMLAWWWTTDNAPALDERAVNELRTFVGASRDSQLGSVDHAALATELTSYPSLTELAVEWRVRNLLGRSASHAAAPVDVEAVLENQANVRIEVVAGLVPRFSVQACVVSRDGALTILVDRIVADSRPLASYRELLARCFAPAALWINVGELPGGDWFYRLQEHDDWPQLLRDCERFALSMLLPARPVLAAAEAAYREIVEQHGWVETETAACTVRNRLAEQFAVPPLLVHTRLTRWPCHVYGRIAQALAAEEVTLPPVDWFEEPGDVRQGMLFAL